MFVHINYIVHDFTQVDQKSIVKIEKATRGQSSSKSWYAERTWRITASKFGELNRITPRRNINKLLSNMLSCRPLETPAVLHGKNYEKKALRAFEKSEGVKTQKCGLFICGKRPYLGASPDAVINDNEIVEVKCPFVGRKDQILPGKRFPFIEKDEQGLTVLKKTSIVL